MQDIFAVNDTWETNEATCLQFETKNNVAVPVNYFIVSQTIVNRAQEAIDPLTDEGNHNTQSHTW